MNGHAEREPKVFQKCKESYDGRLKATSYLVSLTRRESYRSVRSYVMNLDIQRPFCAAFWAEKESSRVYAALHLFPTKDCGAMPANMDMEQ